VVRGGKFSGVDQAERRNGYFNLGFRRILSSSINMTLTFREEGEKGKREKGKRKRISEPWIHKDFLWCIGKLLVFVRAPLMPALFAAQEIVLSLPIFEVSDGYLQVNPLKVSDMI